MTQQRYRLALVEPDEAMRRAAQKEEDRCAVQNYGGSPTADDLWSCMLSASPNASEDTALVEVFARVIDPWAFSDATLSYRGPAEDIDKDQARRKALTKARTLLALVSGEGE